MAFREWIKRVWSRRPSVRRAESRLERYEAPGYWPRTRLQKIGERIGDALGEIWSAVWRWGR